MSFQLRDYQQDTINKIMVALNNGYRYQMVQLPCRTGKSVIMAKLAHMVTNNHKHVLFIVHRRELVNQIKQTFKDEGVDMNYCKIGMVQTITNKVHKINKPDLILVDEAHHALANSYTNILDSYKSAMRLMFTATPYRLNGQGFESIAEILIPGMQVKELIDKKRLSPVDYYAPKSINDAMLKVDTKGDYTAKSMEQATGGKIYGDAVSNYLKLAKGTNAIAYCYSVENAKKLAITFNANGIKAMELDGSTPESTRNKAIKDFKDGKIKVLTNVELFTEGLDLPGVDTVIQLRPTQSLSLFLQFSMRSMNYRPGKRAIIIDHVGNVQRFGLPTDDRKWTIKNRSKKKATTSNANIKSVTVCPHCFASFYATSNICPFCHQAIKDRSDAQLEVDEDEKLTKIDAKKMHERKQKRVAMLNESKNNKLLSSVIGKSPGQLKTLDQYKEYGKLHDYKPGWAYFQAKQKGII